VRSKHDGAASARARGGLARSLLLFLLPVVFLPLVTFAIVIYQQVQADIRRQVTAQLTSLASLKEEQINQWAAARVADIKTLAGAPDLVMAAQAYLAARDDPSAKAVEERLNYYLRGTPLYRALMLTESDTGKVVISTMGAQSDRFMGLAFLDASQLSAARQGAYMLPPVFYPRLGDVQGLVVAPLIAPEQGVIAVLHAFVRYEPLRDTVSPSPGLGTTGHSYVVTKDGYQLGSALSGISAGQDSVGIERARMEHRNGSAIYLDRDGQEVFGVYRWMPAYELAILVEQGTSEALAPLRRFAAVLVAVSLAALVVSALAVFFVTRRLLTGPLETLTEGAMRLAGGDLNAMVTVRSQNEIGVLAEAFNGMATELRGLYQDLESKVEARTQQLEAAAEVGRAATSIVSMDELLSRTVDLIRDRFGFYHVGIFLLDDSGRWAVLQEATGPAGAQLKARGHRLAVGSNSLIGWVTANRQPRIALDVATDEVHFRNELLPDTRSEAALPLRVGDQLIGALDVQSRSLNAFNQSDIDVLQVLADQVAIGLENGRLFARQERAAQLNQRVAHLTARLHRSLSLDAILESAATEVGEAFGARKVVVRLTPEAVPALTGSGTARGSNGSSNGSGGAHEAPTES
jgi:GAF domain-containing protein/HAMP domain-containing protein